MNYIIFDLEFNQDFSSFQNTDVKSAKYPFEIIQIGAVRLDSELNKSGEFNRYVKPAIYHEINPFITELTGITMDQLENEEPFSNVFASFIEFINGADSVFCIWGMSDIKELYRSAEYNKLDNSVLPKKFINLQPFVSKHLNLPSKQLLRLQHAVEALDIPVTNGFHNAFYDALYTSEIFKKIYNDSIEPKLYDPFYIKPRIRQVRKEIDFDGLLQQFEKMYERKMSEEEQGIIKLAYRMGRTNQFLKP